MQNVQTNTGLRNAAISPNAVSVQPILADSQPAQTTAQRMGARRHGRNLSHDRAVNSAVRQSNTRPTLPIYTPDLSVDPITRFQNFTNSLSTSDTASNQEISNNAANLTLAREDLYNSVYVPAQQQLIASLNDNSLVDQARASANENFERSQQRSERERARFGLGQTALERRESDAGLNLTRAKNYDDSVNNARDDQNTRRLTLRNSLIDLGRGLEDAASQGLQAGASNASDRIQANEINAANNRAAKRQQNASLVGTAFMIAAMM